ncbi:MAG: NUDIX domain-containing protein [Lachnospiraceae bacterium]|nr:NUDIX domain-containing protein [Lachnospiraceae bacterium]
MEEYLDIRDEHGNVTGEVKARSLVHRDGDLHGTSHVWIVRKNGKNGYDILLQKRCEGKDSFPGSYDISSAGHIPAGNDYLESAVRELKEELGITVDPKDLRFLGMHKGEVKAEFYGNLFHNHEMSAIFILEKDVKEGELCLQKEEVDSVLWIDYRECLEKMRDKTLRHCIFEDEFETLGENLGILDKKRQMKGSQRL